VCWPSRGARGRQLACGAVAGTLSRPTMRCPPRQLADAAGRAGAACRRAGRCGRRCTARATASPCMRSLELRLRIGRAAAIRLSARPGARMRSCDLPLRCGGPAWRAAWRALVCCAAGRVSRSGRLRGWVGRSASTGAAAFAARGRAPEQALDAAAGACRRRRCGLRRRTGRPCRRRTACCWEQSRLGMRGNAQRQHVSAVRY